MSSKLLVVMFLTVVLVASVTVTTLPVANALTRNVFNDSHTTARFGSSNVCGDHICAPGEREKMSTELNNAQRNAQAGRATTPSTNSTAPAQTTPPAQNMSQGQNIPQTMPTMASPMWKTKTGTITSVQDPGQGHESHQLTLILPPSDKPYHGILTYSASEPVQLVSLVGPIDPADKKGQLVYTIDGKTWFALVFVDPRAAMGTWEFSGNALAVHTMHTTPFQVSYTVDAHN